jgi:hypothetical protein
MNKSRTVSAASLVLLPLVLAACGSEQKPVDPPAAEDQPYARELDKARSVEQTLQQHKDSMDRTLQEQEQPTAE